MGHSDAVNLLALAVAVVLGLAWARSVLPETSAPTLPAAMTVTDSGGVVIPIADYERIASLSLVADGCLRSLDADARIIAHGQALATPLDRFRADRPRVDIRHDVESLLVLEPDLVLLSMYSATEAAVVELRERGIPVLDLGTAMGVDSYCANVQLIATVIGVADQGQRVVAAYRTRLAALRDYADRQLAGGERRALYCSLIGGHLFGGTRGTSYHDVLVHAGLEDIAADRFHGWPEYTVEDLLALAPALLVVPAGQAAAFRAMPGLAASSMRIVEVDQALLGDPGALVPDAVAALIAALRFRQ
ncbi:MAG: ABC transporter substrate-binding protein [Planctomycetota bacterium]|jgi:ABC-type Fe3+-hydroxamate transport system substrate-binding protein